MTLFWVQVTARGVPAGVIPVHGAVTVGRDGDGLVLDDPTVSRRHLELTPSGEALVCRDLGSANGTFVDGVRIDEPRPLTAGARITVGQSELVVHQGRATVPGPSSTGTAGEGRPADAPRPSTAVRALGQAGRRTRRAGPSA
jgi:pSer/pThr/pTyr-binding forkhead associated (FHA) protein